MYHGRIQHDIERNTKGGKLKFCSDYTLRKDAPYLALTGEPWGLFSEFFWRKDTAKYRYCTVFRMCFIHYWAWSVASSQANKLNKDIPQWISVLLCKRINLLLRPIMTKQSLANPYNPSLIKQPVPSYHTCISKRWIEKLKLSTQQFFLYVRKYHFQDVAM